MLITTDAIVLSLQPLSDKAHLLHAYTRECGRVNYKVYGIGRKHAIGLYMPLSVLRITASHPLAGFPTVRETAPAAETPALSSLTTDPYKRAIALFISEVMYHVLRHPMPDAPMFDFLVGAVRDLEALSATDEPEGRIANFHLKFLIDFACKLGFAMVEDPVMPQTREERQKTLRALCAYFSVHVETWQTPRSLEILMEVFD